MEEDLLAGFRRSNDEAAIQAEACFRKAYALHRQGKIESAIKLYRKSIELYPTAEAHTFLGWAYSMRGRLREAIEECRRAIEIDPEFGNPYNDIGAYLIELGRPAEALPWLRQAMEAPRYEPRHFPHINLARAYLLLGEWSKAIEELRAAMRICPSDESSPRLMNRILAALN